MHADSNICEPQIPSELPLVEELANPLVCGEEGGLFAEDSFTGPFALRIIRAFPCLFGLESQVNCM